MWLDSEHRDVLRVGPVSPEDSSCSGRVVLEIGLEDLKTVLAAQVADFMGGETVVPGVCRQITKRLNQLLEELLLVLAQTTCQLSCGEILPEILHLRVPHADCESH